MPDHRDESQLSSDDRGESEPAETAAASAPAVRSRRESFF